MGHNGERCFPTAEGRDLGPAELCWFLICSICWFLTTELDDWRGKSFVNLLGFRSSSSPKCEPSTGRLPSPQLLATGRYFNSSSGLC